MSGIFDINVGESRDLRLTNDCFTQPTPKKPKIYCAEIDPEYNFFPQIQQHLEHSHRSEDYLKH